MGDGHCVMGDRQCVMERERSESPYSVAFSGKDFLGCLVS